MVNSSERARQEYHAHRYLEHLEDEDLRERAKEVFTNALVLTNDCKIGVRPAVDGGRYWIRLWADVLEEFAMRFGSFPAGFDAEWFQDLQIPRPSIELAKWASTAPATVTLSPGSYLVRYGKHKYIRAAYERGCIRISPASRYADPSLNRAIRDNELDLQVQPPESELQFHLIDRVTREPIRQFTPVGNKVTLHSGVDFYVFCLSGVLAPRLFLDFDYDACLVIHRPEMFLRSLLEAFCDNHPGWQGIGVPVKYVDPVFAKIDDMVPLLQKHFRFSYQAEYRVAWISDGAVAGLAPVDLELGPLSEVCDLISAQET